MCLTKDDYNVICDAMLDTIIYIKNVKRHNVELHDLSNEKASTNRDIEQEIREAVMRLNQAIMNSSEENLRYKVEAMKQELRI